LYQKQIQQYRESLWQPWVRVQETHEEILDLPLEIAPELPDPLTEQPVTSVPAPPPSQRTEPDSKSLHPTLKVRSPWQPIERSLPNDIDERNVQVQRTAEI